LYGKELVAIDGSKFKADNSDKRNYTKKQLQTRLAKLDQRITEYLAELESNDRTEEAVDTIKTGEEVAAIVKRLQERKATYEGYVEELERSGETQKSLTDADSRLMKNNGAYDVCYNVQTAVDAKNKLITEFEVTNKVNDVNQITPMTGRVQEILEKKEITIIADAGYDSIQDIVAARNMGAEVHVAGTDVDICVPCERGQEHEITAQQRGRGVYYAERNIALCPMGKVLYPRHYTRSTGKGVFENSKACKACACPCTKNKRLQYQVPMEEAAFSKDYDDTNLSVKQVRITADRELINRRKSIVEHPFGTVKRNMEARTCLTRGLRQVSGEFALLFLAYNLKRVINILGVKPLLDSMA
jgi:hypothetical protein